MGISKVRGFGAGKFVIGPGDKAQVFGNLSAFLYKSGIINYIDKFFI